MKKKSKDQRWRWICAGSLLLASLSGNLEASGLSHPDVNPMEVSQTVRKLRGTILDTNGTPVIGASISVKGTTTGTISDMNGVEVTKSKVRRERMGHIELAAPIAHIWFFKGIPSRIALMLDISPRNLERVIYFASYVVTDKGTSGLMEAQVLNEREYHEAVEKYGRD